MKSRRILVFIAVLLFASMLLFAQAKSEKIVLTFWDENAGEHRTPHYLELIERFNTSQDRIKVEYEGIPSTAAKEKYDVAIATGTTPDIGHANAAWGSNWLAQECVIPLDKYFNSWSESKYINKNYLQLNRELDSEGRLFFITDTVATPLMWIRSDMFKNAGIATPRTWEQFFESAKTLTDRKKGIYGFSLRGGPGSVVELQHAMYAYSGISSYFDEKGICTINNPTHVEFVEKLVGMYNLYTAEGDITNGYKEIVAAFDGGSAAMIFHNTGSTGEHAAALQPNQYQAVSFPISKQGTYSYTAGSQGGYAIFNTCKYQDEAWEFIAFMMSEKSNSYFNEKIGQIPMNDRVLDHDWVAHAQSTKEALSTLASPNTHLVSQPKFLPEYSKIMETLTPPVFQAAIAGKITVKEFLDIWANAMNEAYSNYLKNK